MSTHLVTRSLVVTFALVVAAAALGGCSGSDSTGSSGGNSSGTSGSGTSGATGTSGGTSAATGTCSGDIANCAVGTLSAAQANDMCSILSAAVDDPPGTKLECKSGPQQGQYLTVNSKEFCIANPAPASCKVTVTELLGCFKAAKKDACGALSSSGACGPLLDPASGCSG